MKKQYFLGLALILSAFAFGQSPVTFGARAGISSAGLRGDAIENLGSVVDLTNNMLTTGNRSGFFAGSYVTIPLGNAFSVEPALYYSQKGFALKGNLALDAVKFLGVAARADLRTSYIDVPVVLKATVGGFQIFAGPQVSYLAKANFKTSVGVLGLNLLNKNIDVTDRFNRWDGSVTGGVGYQFANGFNVTAAYDHGLSRVDATNNINSYTKSVKLGLGLRF